MLHRTSSFYLVSGDFNQSFTPSLVKISSIKHHLVMDDCNKLAPTKAVNHNQFWLT